MLFHKNKQILLIHKNQFKKQHNQQYNNYIL